MYRDYNNLVLASQRYNDTSGQVITSCESYSSFARNNLTRHVFQRLARDWNVQIIMVTRRLSGFIPSLYKQHRKGQLYKSRSGRYINYPPMKDMTLYPTLPQYMNQVTAENFIGDPMSTHEFYSDLFGTENVHVIDMEDPQQDVAAGFLCRTLRAPAACAHLLKQQQHQPQLNTNAEFLFDEDLLIVAAFRRGLLTSPSQGRVLVDRHTATLRLQNVLSQNNLTVSYVPSQQQQHDGKELLPQSCLSPEQDDILWKRSLHADYLVGLAHQQRQVLHNDNDSNTALRLRFEEDRSKFCSVDPEAVLQNDSLRLLLFDPSIYQAA